MALSSIRDAQHAANYGGNPLPILRFRVELLTPGFRDGIEFGFSVVVRCAPGTRDPALLHQAYQRGVNCALIDLQSLYADLFNAAGDSVAMQRPHGRESLQNHQIQSALENF